jgi:hypothetical protein
LSLAGEAELGARAAGLRLARELDDHGPADADLCRIPQRRDLRLFDGDNSFDRAASEPDPTVTSIANIVRAVSEATSIPESAMSARGQRRSISRSRGIAALLARESGQATLCELSRALNRSPSAMSSAAHRTFEKALEDPELSRAIHRSRLSLEQARRS